MISQICLTTSNSLPSLGRLGLSWSGNHTHYFTFYTHYFKPHWCSSYFSNMFPPGIVQLKLVYFSRTFLFQLSYILSPHHFQFSFAMCVPLLLSILWQITSFDSASLSPLTHKDSQSLGSRATEFKPWHVLLSACSFFSIISLYSICDTK